MAKGYSSEVDLWACGVCLYSMLSGVQAFVGTSKEAIYDNIVNKQVGCANGEGSGPGVLDQSRSCYGIYMYIYEGPPVHLYKRII